MSIGGALSACFLRANVYSPATGSGFFFAAFAGFFFAGAFSAFALAGLASFFALRWRLLLFAAALGRAVGNQRDCLFQGDRSRIVAVRHRRVGRSVGDIRTEAPLHQLDRRAARIVAEFLQRFGAAASARIGFLFRDHRAPRD